MADHESQASAYSADDNLIPRQETPAAAADRRAGPNSLLLVKLRPPSLPPDSVSRPRLVKTLKRALDHPLTLVSAPTGFGKSTLVVQALAELDAPVAIKAVLDAGQIVSEFPVAGQAAASPEPGADAAPHLGSFVGVGFERGARGGAGSCVRS